MRTLPIALMLAWSMSAGVAFAQEPSLALPATILQPASAGLQAQGNDSPAGVENPWSRRPVCASLFLKSEWQLSGKQRTCDWIQNRMLSNGALFGAVSSALVSKIRDPEPEQGDSFAVRFGRRYAQSAFKSTGAYLGGLIAREDPRLVPPYLVMQTQARPRGFWRRTGHAFSNHLMSYDCIGECRAETDIRRRFAMSRVLGAIASGYGGEVWTWDRPDSHARAWRGVASAYGSSVADAIYTEFKPELNAAAGKVFGGLFGFR
jgi:hypothetical protein